MRIEVKEHQNESYENLIVALLIMGSENQRTFTLGEISWDDLTPESFDSFVEKWRGVSFTEGVPFSLELNRVDIVNELKDMDAELISIVESDGNEVSNYPVDESQTISNAGDAVQYMYDGKLYEIITWNMMADEHEPESKTISELEKE